MGINIYRKNTSNSGNNGNATNEVKQIVKLNVEANHVTNIDNTDNNNFKNIFDVYKITGSQDDVIKLLADFANDESSNFVHSNNVVFDGDMKLKTNFSINSNFNRAMGQGSEYTYSIDKSKYKNVIDITYSDDKVNLNAIPVDELIIANDFISLEGIQNIDKLILVANNVKVILDNGSSWFTWDNMNNKFIAINATIDDVKVNGIDVDIFNSIPSLAWDELLLVNKKIRFAYLLVMNSINDNVKTGSISMQVDINGYYTKSIPGTDYNINLKQNNIEIEFLKNNSYIVNYL
ncbi:hypothetical protein Ccar_16155 [Clostridium carboxidivorans P7]|uniref:Uncharacterized protein n=1 Tax=Clostridium carboxidivorans P7 TaxID=536227 RepID=C6Q149_9CLOT|nr:hypothetical protein [Clostridium carboxidivorans]AKN32312.1 hypothetical protein Ccar_16155 [Clostridium carboxidivorans P7]EET84785.1 conserved hypothetical protein [Clostridium carboxidivorans P7]